MSQGKFRLYCTTGNQESLIMAVCIKSWQIIRYSTLHEFSGYWHKMSCFWKLIGNALEIKFCWKHVWSPWLNSSLIHQSHKCFAFVSVLLLTYNSQNVGWGLEGFILDASSAVDYPSIANHMTREHKTSFAVPEHILSICYQFFHWILLLKSKTIFFTAMLFSFYPD